jgi:integrase
VSTVEPPAFVLQGPPTLGVTAAEVDRYKNAKLHERERGLSRLSNNSINETVVRLGQVLELAVEYDLIPRNPAVGKARRLKGEPRKRASMPAEQVRALLDAAGKSAARGARYEAAALQRRALLATAIMAGGLRVSEVTGLRWRNVDLAGGRLTVEKSKTEAGLRTVDLTPDLRDELAAYKAALGELDRDDYVYPGRCGRRDRGAALRRVLKPAIKRAHEALAKNELLS